MRIEEIFKGTPITLTELLDRKEARAVTQKKLLSGGGLCLISFSLNIPGMVKQFPLAEAAFLEGVSEIRRMLPAGCLLRTEEVHEVTGPEGFFLLNLEPGEVKKKTASLEENHPLGRLFDIDVLDPDGHALSRTDFGLPPRACLICNQNAKLCARSRAHSMELLLWKTASILEEFFRDRAADRAAACAVRALLYEVSTTPKPGLVDRTNSGSHKDMDFFTFLDSSGALTPWFRDFFCIGWESAGQPVPLIFSRLRFAGEEAEAAMFSATRGVNTHKGLIFSFAILCGALGAVHFGENLPLSRKSVLELCRQLGECSLGDFDKHELDFSDGRELTAGEVCYRSYGISGARGQAALGFPAAVLLGVPALRHWTEKGLSVNDAAALTLLTLISRTEDTNMIHRGGAETAARCREEAGRILEEITPDNFHEKLTALDTDYIRRNLSPGGCADLLAVSLMFFFLEECGYVCT